ncbi:MAG TPA: DMT family transporter, partial [Gemmataceae bacterium]|nr:DMT family transporter [Gemmataceae bacterium]
VLVVVGSLALVYRPTQQEWSRQKKGILLAIAASFFFSLNSCFDRLAVQEGTPVFAGFTMTLLSTLVFCPFLFGNPERIETVQKYEVGLFVRGFMEIAFMVCKLYALQYLQAPYVVALQRFSLILSIIGGRVFFKETDFARRLASGVVILLGVVLIAWIEINRPFD